jgi:hypothetical protein
LLACPTVFGYSTDPVSEQDKYASNDGAYQRDDRCHASEFRAKAYTTETDHKIAAAVTSDHQTAILKTASELPGHAKCVRDTPRNNRTLQPPANTTGSTLN